MTLHLPEGSWMKTWLRECAARADVKETRALEFLSNHLHPKCRQLGNICVHIKWGESNGNVNTRSVEKKKKLPEMSSLTKRLVGQPLEMVSLSVIKLP